MADGTNDVDVRKLRTLIKRYALEGMFSADEVLAVGSNASDEQAAWARELAAEMPENSKPWMPSYGQNACQNACCNPWAFQRAYDSTDGSDPWV